jgi:hypothetical protein
LQSSIHREPPGAGQEDVETTHRSLMSIGDAQLCHTRFAVAPSRSRPPFPTAHR